jgi:hypothetical protein
MTRDGATGTITLRGDYSDFRPSSGEVDVWVKAQVAADAGGFSSATASYNSQDISSSIVWTR